METRFTVSSNQNFNSMKPQYLTLLALALCALVSGTHAQEARDYKNAVVFELGGNGLAYSLNYERRFDQNVHTRVGFSAWKIIENQTDKSLTVMSFPVSFNYLNHLGGQKHYLESGLGVMNLVTTGDLVEFKGVTNYYLNPFVNLGYRYQPVNRRWTFRAGLSPFLGTKSVTNPTAQGFRPLGSRVQAWGYLGIGYRF